MDCERALAECERLWREERDIAGVLAAVKLCAENEWILPRWCKRPAMEGLRLLAVKGGRGHRSPNADLAAKNTHQRHHNLVMAERSKGKTLEEAWEAVASRERKTADAIRHSYKMIRRTRAIKQRD